MSSILFAVPPPEILLVFPLGVVAVVLIASLLVAYSSRREVGRKQGRIQRGIHAGGFAFLCLLAGPLVGLAFGWILTRIDPPNPKDLAHLIVSMTVLGCIAGFLGAGIFAIVGRSGSDDAETMKPELDDLA